MTTPLWQIRRDVAADWTADNPVLEEGQLGGELDTGKLKFGNGVDAWADLPYVDGVGGGGGGSITPPTIRDFASNYASGAGTITLTVPAGTQAGDLLVVFVGSADGLTSVAGGNVTSAGWSILQIATGGFMQGGAAAAIASGSSAGATITLTMSSGNFHAAALAVVQDWTCVVGFGVAQNASSIATLGSPAIPSAARDGVLVIGFGCARVATTTITSNLPTTKLTRAADASLSSGLWCGSPTQLLRHVVTTPTNAALLSAAVAVSG